MSLLEVEHAAEDVNAKQPATASAASVESDTGADTAGEPASASADS